MSDYKLRIKIGEHEFEAQGDRAEVERDFERFSEIIERRKPSAAPAATTRPFDTPPPLFDDPNIPQQEAVNPPSPANISALQKIYRVDGNRPISLSALPQGERREKDAVLLLLYGYREFRQQELVNGIQLLEGVKTSGYNVDRVDRIVYTYVNTNEPLISTVGQRRGLQYRLTNRGYVKAKEIADEIIKMVV